MLTRTLVCCLIHFISVLSVDGVTLSLNPPSMVIGSSTVNPMTSLNIQCSSSGTLDVGTLIQLKLSRRKFTEPTFVGIASMNYDGLAKFDPTVPSDIQNRSPNITGSFDIGLKSGTMTLSINAQGLSCTDQAEFQCLLTYFDTNQIGQRVTDNNNFTVIVVPSEVIIDIPEYYDVNGNTLQLINNSVLNTGTRIKYRCTANVGSVPEGEIIWERSSEMGSIYSFIPYTPTQSTDIVQETSQQNGCFYRRTSTMYYNLTMLDEDGISFRCRARSYLSGQLYEALANQQYRAVAAPSGGTTRSTTQLASTRGETAGPSAQPASTRGETAGPSAQPGSNINISTVVAIVLGLMVGVFFVLIVILSVCLHRYRKLAELQSQELSRARTYDDLNRTTQSSGPYAVLNAIPLDLQSQEQSRAHTYDALNETRQSSGPYAALNVFPSDGNVRREEKPYVHMAHNEL